MKFTSFIIFLLVANFCSAARTVQFMYFHKPADAPEKVFMFEEKKGAVEVELPAYNFTQAYDIGPGQQTLFFLSSVPEEGKDMPKNPPKVNIPAGWQKVLVLAFRDSSNKTMPIRFTAFNASNSEFGKGDTLFINLSPKVVYGMLGRAKVIVKPGKTLVTKNASSDGKDYNVTLWQMNPDKSENYRFLTKVFRNYTNRRKVFFVFMPEGKNQPDYYVTTIQDPIPVAKE
ncbi:hypothetical protein [Luteolibacter sp. AS25]|uniref:hypothetical protein n=1 Tax=Luteolibacter sp. AS25 TaxID=3135776 RepID=UPI00398B4E41